MTERYITGSELLAKVMKLIGIGVTFVLVACGCAGETQEPSFDGDRALQLVQTQLDFGYRIPGTESHRRTGDWIMTELKDHGWEVEEQYFQYFEIEGRNIIGKAQERGGEWIILGAHYDTRPVADRDRMDDESPVPGANDGGSGVGVLLELARILDPVGGPNRVWLVFFDVEDSGGLGEKYWIAGSTYFVDQLEGLPDAAVVVDMVGDKDLQIFYELNSDFDLAREIWGVASELGFGAFRAEPKHSIIDDHIPFVRRGIPAVDIIDIEYAYWHTTEDTLDKISSESLDMVGETLLEWIRRR
jgi:Zn-dependent M28 family amino/carboxypeptidase